MADGAELFGREAVEVVFGEMSVAEQRSEDDGQDGVAELEGAVEPVAAFGEPALQFPESGGLGGTRSALPGLADDSIEFAAACEVEGPAGVYRVVRVSGGGRDCFVPGQSMVGKRSGRAGGPLRLAAERR